MPRQTRRRGTFHYLKKTTYLRGHTRQRKHMRSFSYIEYLSAQQNLVAANLDPLTRKASTCLNRYAAAKGRSTNKHRLSNRTTLGSRKSSQRAPPVGTGLHALSVLSSRSCCGETPRNVRHDHSISRSSFCPVVIEKTQNRTKVRLLKTLFVPARSKPKNRGLDARGDAIE